MPLFVPTDALISQTLLTSGTSFRTSGLTTRILIQLVGGGGGAGGSYNQSTNTSFGSGGGAGSYAIKLFDVAPGVAYTYAIGGGGAGGANGWRGDPGGDTTFTVGATTVTAYGGSNGTAANAGTSLVIEGSGAGGLIAVNGDLNSTGQSGGVGFRESQTVCSGGKGGSGPFGAGGGVRSTQGDGFPGGGYGAGGSGSVTIASAGPQTGGSGSGGCILVTEFGAVAGWKGSQRPRRKVLLRAVLLTAGTSFTTGNTATELDVQLVGAGGGGGGCTGKSSNSAGSGAGGAGGFARKLFVVSAGTSYTYAIGTAGTAGSGATAGTGGTGGNTTFTVGGTTVTANGGSGGTGMAFGTAPAFVAGGAGGSASNGDINCVGDPGERGARYLASVAYGGQGAMSNWSGGTQETRFFGTGPTALGYGGGGGGTVSGNNTDRNGGAGAPGAIFVLEYGYL